MPSAITVRGLTKSYGKNSVLREVDLDIRQGEVFGLLGRNGAGKTTLIECIQGLRSRDAGVVDLLGLDPAADAKRLHQVIGCQLQSAGLPDRLRVGEAIALFALEGRSAVPDVLLRCGLSAQVNDYVGQLSGGQRQRLFVALAWLNDPKVVFLDEMTQGLDAEARNRVWDDVKARQGADTTVVLVSHFADELDALCDRIGVLSDGRIVAVGTPAELVRRFELKATLTGSDPFPSPSLLGPCFHDNVAVDSGGHVATFSPHHLVGVCAALERSAYRGDVVIRPPNLGDVLGHCTPSPSDALSRVGAS